MSRLSIVLFASLSVVAACGGKKSEGGAAASGSAAAAPTKLAKLGLALDVPGEVNVGEGMGPDSAMIQGPGIGAMMVETDAKPQSLDEAKADANDYSPKNVKGDPLPDGWTLTYDNTGSAGANYFVTVRRDLGGKSYKCSTTGSDPGQAQAVLAACKSLRKA